ncbi:hypothetical protein K438DRAFT_1990203 [Mycena galopus ATCC 62051]|nr:hypothetical protein K438DRAFT_1990203 [Mycena galopus ATCC 62051]
MSRPSLDRNQRWANILEIMDHTRSRYLMERPPSAIYEKLDYSIVDVEDGARAKIVLSADNVGGPLKQTKLLGSYLYEVGAAATAY